MTNNATETTVAGAAMTRGLPRPLNRRGLPVPYVAESPERLGDKSLTRAPEVTRDWLCQVCGEPNGDLAYALMLTEPAHWEPDWVLDHGLLHETCLRLALKHCPSLQHYLILSDQKLRLLLVRRDQVTMTTDLQLVIPVADHEDLDVPLSGFLSGAW
jgi:hypothetical protein